MSDHHTYKKVESVGQTKKLKEEAIRKAIAECNKSIKNLDWFEVVETRGSIEKSILRLARFKKKIGFKIEES